MGMDVNLYAEVDPTPEQLVIAEQFFTARSWIGDPYGARPNVLIRRTQDWLPAPRVEVQTLSRYYGPGYERGEWPTIYGAIRVLQATFPDATVFYGSDSTDEGFECDDKFLAEIWSHFLSASGDNYRKENG